MKLFATHVLLTVIWAGLLGHITVGTLVSGFVLGYLILFGLFGRQESTASYFNRIPKILSFFAYYVAEIIRSNVIIAYDILFPSARIKPGVVAIPLEASTDLEITLLANLISMTPGTLSIDVSTDRKVLYVHAMYVNDPDDLRAEIKTKLESRVLKILR